MTTHHSASSDPDPRDLVRQVRQTLGLFDGAMPHSYAEVWAEALDAIRTLMHAAGRPCITSSTQRCHCRPDLPTYHYTAAEDAAYTDP